MACPPPQSTPSPIIVLSTTESCQEVNGSFTFTGTLIIYQTPAGAPHHAFSQARHPPSAIQPHPRLGLQPPIPTIMSHTRTGPPPSKLPRQKALSDILRPNPQGTPSERHCQRAPQGSQSVRAAETEPAPEHRRVPRLSGFPMGGSAVFALRDTQLH